MTVGPEAARAIDRDFGRPIATSGSVALWPRLSTALSALPIILLIARILSPVAMTLIGSFRISLPGQPNVWGVSGWVQAFTSPSIAESIVNTFLLSFMRVPLAILIGALLAWLLIRTNLPGRKAIEFLFWVSFFLPVLPVAMAWILLLDPKAGWINRLITGPLGFGDPWFNAYTYLGITWVHVTATSVPVMIILLGPAFRALDPSMEESARMCGASRFAVLRRIVLPLMFPALMVAGIASFIRSLEAFEVELLLGTPAGIRVYATKIQELATWEPPRYAPSMALSVPFITLLFMLSLLHQRFIRNRNVQTITGKATAGPLVDLGLWRLPLSILCSAIVTVSVLVPVAALVTGSFMEVFGMARADGSLPFTVRHWQVVFNDTVFARSVVNTLQLAAGTALIGIFFYSMLAYILLRSKVPGRDVLAVVVWLPWAFPGILLSLSLLWMYLGTPLLAPLYGSMLGLIVAMLFKELPIGVNLMKTGLLQISSELEDAARMCGANVWQIYWRLVIPLLAPGAVAVGTICFIACIKDLSTMILLSTPETRPLSLLVLDYTSNGSLERGAVVGVIAAAMAVGAALVGRWLGHRLNSGLGRA